METETGMQEGRMHVEEPGGRARRSKLSTMHNMMVRELAIVSSPYELQVRLGAHKPWVKKTEHGISHL